AVQTVRASGTVGDDMVTVSALTSAFPGASASIAVHYDPVSVRTGNYSLTLTILPSPASIPADGFTVGRVVAVLRDPVGNCIGDALISASATLGFLGTAGTSHT